MFKTKIRGFTFGLIMSYAMAIGMEIYNMALKYGFQAQPGGLSGLSYAAVGEALTETLYMGLLVLCCFQTSGATGREMRSGAGTATPGATTRISAGCCARAAPWPSCARP